MATQIAAVDSTRPLSTVDPAADTTTAKIVKFETDPPHGLRLNTCKYVCKDTRGHAFHGPDKNKRFSMLLYRMIQTPAPLVLAPCVQTPAPATDERCDLRGAPSLHTAAGVTKTQTTLVSSTSLPPAMSAPYLTIAGARDAQNRPVVLLRGRYLPGALDATHVSHVLGALGGEPFVLVYLHAGVEAPGLARVRAFRRAVEGVDGALRARVAAVIAVHVSAVLRAQIYYMMGGMEEYKALLYCDLLQDLEAALGVDSCVLGMEREDLEYDEVMRCWVGRQLEGVQVEAPDPSKPLFKSDPADYSWNSAAPEPPSQTERLSRMDP